METTIVCWGFNGDNAKENGNYCLGLRVQKGLGGRWCNPGFFQAALHGAARCPRESHQWPDK